MPIDSNQFPYAAYEGYLETSPQTRKYNCIAYAAGDTGKWWWPLLGHWPKGVPKKETINAFLHLFEKLGYTKCKSGEYEPGYEKIAIYALNDKVTHAARQLQNGHWTSKMGPSIDIEHHTLEALNGPVYGKAVRFLKKKF